MSDIHDALGGSLVSRCDFFHLLIVLICGSSRRIYHPTHPPSLLSGPHPSLKPKPKTRHPESQSTPHPSSTSTTASAAAALSDLQAQLHDTQTSRATSTRCVRWRGCLRSTMRLSARWACGEDYGCCGGGGEKGGREGGRGRGRNRQRRP